MSSETAITVAIFGNVTLSEYFPIFHVTGWIDSHVSLVAQFWHFHLVICYTWFLRDFNVNSQISSRPDITSHDICLDSHMLSRNRFPCEIWPDSNICTTAWYQKFTQCIACTQVILLYTPCCDPSHVMLYLTNPLTTPHHIKAGSLGQTELYITLI